MVQNMRSEKVRSILRFNGLNFIYMMLVIVRREEHEIRFLQCGGVLQRNSLPIAKSLDVFIVDIKQCY
jgi:hypothetical protein